MQSSNTLPNRLPALALLAVLLAAGCATRPPESGAQAEAPAAHDALADARRLAAEGRHGAAADAFASLASAAAQGSPRQVDLRLRSAREHVLAGDLKSAEAMITALRVPAGEPGLALRRSLLHAEITRVLQGAAAALALLPTSSPDSLSLAIRRDLHDLRARLLLHAGDPLASARERLVLSTLLDAPGEITVNQRALLAALHTLGPALPAASTVEADLGGWVELARLVSGPPRRAETLDADFAAWRARHPDHPLTPTLRDELRTELQMAAAPERIAVLLPASGPFANVAAAIRDGLIAARLASGPAERTELRFYDTAVVEPGEVGAIYARAVADGAQFIVGPVRKEAVAALASGLPPRVPLLALNRLPAGLPRLAGFYQFALDPEHEAQQVAERAWQDGHRRMALLYPEGDLGNRAADAFSERFSNLGGEVVDQHAYAAGENDFSDPITALLQLQASEARERRLRALLGRRLEFEPRRRQDLDALFIVALPRQARLLRPQIDFHHAAEVPVYASSLVYAPGSRPEDNRDLDRLRFCDMPWTLLPTDPQIAGGLAAAEGALARLFAFGVDAYSLLPYLAGSDPGRQGRRIDGLTGVLGLGADGVVARQMLCADFELGTPRLLGFTPFEVTAAERNGPQVARATP